MSWEPRVMARTWRKTQPLRSKPKRTSTSTTFDTRSVGLAATGMLQFGPCALKRLLCMHHIASICLTLLATHTTATTGTQQLQACHTPAQRTKCQAA